jgi:uncharacterized protein YoxC
MESEMSLPDELQKLAKNELVPIIVGTIAGLVKALQDLGEDIPDLVAASDKEVARIGEQQAANEAAAAAAMGLPNKGPTV